MNILKKICLLIVLTGVLFSCKNDDNEPEELTCEQAEQAVIEAFAEAISLGTVEACEAYRDAVLAQGAPCNYDVACLMDELELDGTTCVDNGSSINVGSTAIVNIGSTGGPDPLFPCD